jgi:adenylate cyclase
VTERTSRVLVVDDHATNRLKLSMAVRKLGLEVETAEDGRDALKRLQSEPFDLVLLDLLMPEMDGFEVLSTMKSDLDLRGIPVVIISALDEIDSIAKAIKLGAEDHLPKSFDPVLLEARVSACLEKKRLRDLEVNFLREIETEKRRSDALLNAMLPAAAVHELKTTNEVKPRRFEEVTILFSDIADFTAYSDAHSPEKVVDHLQELVRAFEEIAAKHGLEKIKTIGDAFLATAGLFQYVPEPALAAVRCGLEMAETAPRLSAGWQVHVGIHTGPLVAGIIGYRQYLFDIWGDSVNIAARVVDQAPPGSVLVSESAWRHVGLKAQGTSHGVVELKGKGGMELIECRGLRDVVER